MTRAQCHQEIFLELSTKWEDVQSVIQDPNAPEMVQYKDNLLSIRET